MRDSYSIAIQGATINLEVGNFKGNVPQAIDVIQKFCGENNVRIESIGHGYNELHVNDQCHDLTPYGIDIEMMLGFCGFNNSLSQKKVSLLNGIIKDNRAFLNNHFKFSIGVNLEKLDFKYFDLCSGKVSLLSIVKSLEIGICVDNQFINSGLILYEENSNKLYGIKSGEFIAPAIGKVKLIDLQLDSKAIQALESTLNSSFRNAMVTLLGDGKLADIDKQNKYVFLDRLYGVAQNALEIALEANPEYAEIITRNVENDSSFNFLKKIKVNAARREFSEETGYLILGEVQILAQMSSQTREEMSEAYFGNKNKYKESNPNMCTEFFIAAIPNQEVLKKTDKEPDEIFKAVSVKSLHLVESGSTKEISVHVGGEENDLPVTLVTRSNNLFLLYFFQNYTTVPVYAKRNSDDSWFLSNIDRSQMMAFGSLLVASAGYNFADAILPNSTARAAIGCVAMLLPTLASVNKDAKYYLYRFFPLASPYSMNFQGNSLTFVDNGRVTFKDLEYACNIIIEKGITEACFTQTWGAGWYGVSLPESKLGFHHIDYLLEMLANPKCRLESLNLHSNLFGNNIGKIILAANDRLKFIDVTDNALTEEMITKIRQLADNKNITLKGLNDQRVEKESTYH